MLVVLPACECIMGCCCSSLIASKFPGGDSEVAEVFLRFLPLVSEDESCDELSAERDETSDRELYC